MRKLCLNSCLKLPKVRNFWAQFFFFSFFFFEIRGWWFQIWLVGGHSAFWCSSELNLRVKINNFLLRKKFFYFHTLKSFLYFRITVNSQTSLIYYYVGKKNKANKQTNKQTKIKAKKKNLISSQKLKAF